MDTKIIRDEMNRLDKISGLDTSMVPIRISSRMTRGWGLCSCTKVGRQFQVREIVFAKRLLKHGTPEHILNVVRHEYAHAYVTVRDNKGHGHDAVWRQAALRFGCNAKRCENFDEVDDAVDNSKYKVTCQCCGTSWKYQRKAKIVQELEKKPDSERFRCGKCDSHKFALEVL